MSAIPDTQSSRDLYLLLLAERATQGLCAHQMDELERLHYELEAVPGCTDLDLESFERAATAANYAFALADRSFLAPAASHSRPSGELPLPEHLEERLRNLASEFTDFTRAASNPLDGSPRLSPANGSGASTAVLPFRHAVQQSASGIPPGNRSEASASGAAKAEEADADPAARVRNGSTAGWWIAAAALLLASLGWWPRLAGTSQGGGDPASASPVEVASRAPALVGADGLAAASLVIPLQGTEDPTASGATGFAEWNPRTQRGVLRISGLAPNDPQQFQYQLWIFDSSRDERFPVDGGVFDVPSDAEPGQDILIPIDARVLVRDPALFAITVEAPGGTVVSQRERIVLAGASASA